MPWLFERRQHAVFVPVLASIGLRFQTLKKDNGSRMQGAVDDGAIQRRLRATR